MKTFRNAQSALLPFLSIKKISCNLVKREKNSLHEDVDNNLVDTTLQILKKTMDNLENLQC